MPGKSRRGRGKHSTRSKRRQGTVARVAQQPAATATYEPVAPPVPSPRMPSPPRTPTGVRHPYIVTELRRIGILAGVMLAILVVLALVLP